MGQAHRHPLRMQLDGRHRDPPASVGELCDLLQLGPCPAKRVGSPRIAAETYGLSDYSEAESALTPALGDYMWSPTLPGRRTNTSLARSAAARIIGALYRA